MKQLRVICIIAIACCGCGKTSQDVINEYRPKLQPKRDQLQAVAQKLSAPDKGKLTLNPLPAFDKKGRRYNTEILGVEQLSDADARPQFDLILSGPLLDCLLWTGPKNPMSPSALTLSAGKDFAAQFEEALACRYVVAYRTLDYK